MELLKETKFEMPTLLYNFYQESASISHREKLGFKWLSNICVFLLTTVESCCSGADSQIGPASCLESNMLAQVLIPDLQKLGGNSLWNHLGALSRSRA